MTPMNVKCLSKEEQDHLVRMYVTMGVSQVDLASIYLVSRRSIQRVLEVYGVLHYNYDTTTVQQPKNKPAVTSSRGQVNLPSPTKQMNMVLTTTTTVSNRPSPEEEKHMLDFLHDHRIDLPRLAKLVHAVKEVANARDSY